MKQLTWKQRCIAYLEHYGYVKQLSTTSKYVVYYKDTAKVKYYYFIGDSGAVRVSKNRVVSDTTSITDAFHKQVVKFEQRQVKGIDNE